MTFTYDVTDYIGQIRLIINDTTEATAHFSDEEIGAFYTLAGSSVNLAAARALESWAASLSRDKFMENIGRNDYMYQNKSVEWMLALADKLKEEESSTPAEDWAEFDFGDY